MTERFDRELVFTATPALLLVFAVVAVLMIGCAAPAPTGTTGEPPAPIAGETGAGTAGAATAVVIKSPTCGCCGGHEDYMREAGMSVKSVTQVDMTDVKDRYGVPTAMRSCHTTDVAGYFVEGHVPMAAIEQLMADRPDIDGIALPGMPAGSPGMAGVKEAPFVVYAVRGGEVVGEFGSY
jgi:hypothetical protein